MTLDNLPPPEQQAHQPRAFANLQKSYNRTIPREKIHEMVKTEAFQKLMAQGLIQNKNEREVKVCLQRVDSPSSPKMHEAKRKSIAVIAEILMEKRKSMPQDEPEESQKTQDTNTSTPLPTRRTESTPYDDLTDEEVMLMALEIFDMIEHEHLLQLSHNSEEIDSEESNKIDTDKKSEQKERTSKDAVRKSIEELRKQTEKSRSEAFADLEAIYLKADREEIRKFYLGLLEARELASQKRERVLDKEQKNEAISNENLSQEIKNKNKT